MQVYLDFDTPASVLETVEERVSGHLDNHPKEFSGAHNTFHNAIGNPLKLRLGIFFEYSHTGAPRSSSQAHSDISLGRRLRLPQTKARLPLALQS